MSPTDGDPELLNHYTVVVYPFRHELTGRARLARLDALGPRWAPWSTRLADDDLAAALEATTFFLPYIRSLLYPEVHRLQEETLCDDYPRWVRLLREWSAEGLGAFCAGLPCSGVLRLTGRPGLLRDLASFTLVPAHRPRANPEPAEVPARLDWLDALLFPCGVGFLLLKVRLAGGGPRLADLVRLNHALRLVPPTTVSAPPALLRFAGGQEFTVAGLMNFLTQGLVAPWDVPEEERGLVPAAPPACRRPYTDTEAGRLYGEHCHLLSYAAVGLAAGTAELPAGPFPSAADRILFEYATCIGLGESVRDPMWVPSAEQAARLCRDNRVSLWRCWTGMVLKEAFVFLGTEDLPFTRRYLPRYVENDYLPLYLYVLYQKFQLFTFSTDLMHEVARSAGRLRRARALLQRFVTFRSQYWFNEVTRKPQGGDLYRTLQQGLEVPRLYELVTSSVKEVKEYYEGVWARQVQWAKDVLTFGGPVTVAAGAVRMFAWGGGLADWTAAGTAAAVAAAGLVFFLGWRRGLGWRREHRGGSRRKRAALPVLGRPHPGAAAGAGAGRVWRT
jgi:hypothetical protein